MAVDQSARCAVENQQEQQGVHDARQMFAAASGPIGNAAGHCFEHYVTVGKIGTLKTTIDARAHQCQRHFFPRMQPLSRVVAISKACSMQP